MSYIGIKHRRGLAADWTTDNPVLLEGQFGFELDTFTLSGGKRIYKAKFGDGVTAWNDLPYFALSAGGGGGGATAFVDLTDVPSSYVGQAGKYLKVTETADGVEFETIEAADLPTGIDAAKIGDGSVSNAEFQRINSVTSNVQDQLDAKLPTASYTAADVLAKLLTVDGPGSGLDADLLDGQSSAAYEQVTNKAIDFSTVNDTKYPTVEAVAEYVASAVSGLLDDRGNYNASGNTFPASGGSGTAGVILKGDLWTVSVAGTLGGSAVEIGDIIRALVDTPGQTASNWAVTQNNITYVPENQANKENSTLDTSTTKYPTNRLAKEYADAKVADAINNGTTTIAPSQNAVFDALALKADDSAVVHNTGNENVGGVKTFTSDPIIPDEAYGSGWNGSLEPPTKNAVYDKIETMGGGGLTNWTEAYSNSSPNNTVTVVSFFPNTVDSNTTSVLGSKGTGALQRQVADSSSTGGNPRGSYAVDWQSDRSLATEVASGLNATVSGGKRNKASGDYSGALCGYWNNANGPYDVCMGNNNDCDGNQSGILCGATNGNYAGWSVVTGGISCIISSYLCAYSSITGGRSVYLQDAGYQRGGGYNIRGYLYGADTYGPGVFSGNGDNQRTEVQPYKLSSGITTGGTFVVRLDGSGTTYLMTPYDTDSLWNVSVQVQAVVTAISGTATGISVGDVFTRDDKLTLKRVSGTSTIVGSVEKGTSRNDTSQSTCDMNYTIGGSNDLVATFTGATFAGGGSLTYRVSTVMRIAEIAW